MLKCSYTGYAYLAAEWESPSAVVQIVGTPFGMSELLDDGKAKVCRIVRVCGTLAVKHGFKEFPSVSVP